MGRRPLLMVVAVLLAALGAGLVFVYASHANDRALADQHPVEVVVAKQNISPGTKFADANAQGMFVRKTVARDSVAPGALGPDQLSQLTGKVALSTIFTGEQVLAAKFGSRTSLSPLPIPAGLLAYSVAVDVQGDLAGYAQPGSSVTVISSVGNSSRVLIPTALVLAVGTNTDAAAGGNGGQGTQQGTASPLTLALSTGDALKVATAQQQGGRLSYALRNDKSIVDPNATATNQPG